MQVDAKTCWGAAPFVLIFGPVLLAIVGFALHDAWSPPSTRGPDVVCFDTTRDDDQRIEEIEHLLERGYRWRGGSDTIACLKRPPSCVAVDGSVLR